MSRTPKLPPLERAAQEAQEGRLWRAKQILAGCIASAGYQPATFAAYGRILVQMHDSQEAGKYLFLSGLAEHREEEWVELFLSSVRGKPCEWIFSRFPSAGRKASLADYPERVQTGLKSLGFPDDFRNKNGSLALPVEKLSKFKETMVVAIALTIFLLMLLGLFNGLTVVGRWIFGK